MTSPRERRRPGAGTPFVLTPNVEAIVPTAPAEPHQPTTPAPTETPVTPAPAERPAAAPPRTKVARTFQIPSDLLGMAQTAVLRTAGQDGGHSSLNALVENAMIRELQRLAQEFNEGQPFPAHTGAFRTGRPIGTN